jgi:1-acyl-sn-glycerol-3-phosphate acyltransferase
VALTFPPPKRGPKIDRIAREPFEKEGKAIPVDSDKKNALEFVACGKPLIGHEIRIVDNKDRVLPERRVGNLHFRGPSSMQGYYRNPQATEEIYHDGWWDTGDLAYIADGEVYITGRKKDVIIKAGRNIYPTEVEEITSQVQGVRKGCVAAFGAKDPNRGTEKLIIVAETHEKEEKNREKIISNITENVASIIGIPPDQIILVGPRTVLKTSSGKLRRSATLDAYLKGKLGKPATPAWFQIVKLFISGQSRITERWLGKIGKFFYTGYIGILLFFTFLPAWLAVNLVSRSKAQKIAQRWAQIVIKFSGCSFSISGQENLTKDKHLIYVSNHSSYSDFVVLIATLPADSVFIAKQELMNTWIIKNLLQRCGHLTVERFDLEQSLLDAKRIEETLQQQRSIIIFPEGTFTYAAGLRPFKLGAFKLAVETGTAICPVSLRGTRSILRSGSHLLKLGKIKVHISQPIAPKSKEWSEVIRLRNAARAEIAKHSGEPTLDLIRAGYEKEMP